MRRLWKIENCSKVAAVIFIIHIFSLVKSKMNGTYIPGATNTRIWFVVAALLIGAYLITKLQIRAFLNSSLEKVDKMNGYDFEYYCGNLLIKNGFRDIKITGKSGDFGVDILAKKGVRTYAIQCKRYSDKVGQDAVRQIMMGQMRYKSDVAVVMTNSFLTSGAINIARQNGVQVWDRNTIENMQGTSKKTS